MTILVLGGTRFMGKHFVQELLAGGHAVTLATRGITMDAFGDKVRRLVVERGDAQSLIQTLSSQEYDVVIDSLAYCSNDVRRLLQAVTCKRYLQISSASVYASLRSGIQEEDFDAAQKQLVFCDKNDFPYDEAKRQAECAVVQEYPQLSAVRIRFPFVLGTDDYTNRFYFYVEHAVKQQPMYIDNLDAKMAFVRSDEAGKLIAFLAQSHFTGAINAASTQAVSMQEILAYIKQKTGKEAVLHPEGEPAPYNGVAEYSLDTGKAASLGFLFTPLKSWIYELVDFYLALLGDENTAFSKAK